MGSWVPYSNLGSIYGVLEAEEKRGCGFLTSLLANTWSNQLIRNILPCSRARFYDTTEIDLSCVLTRPD